VLHSWILLAFLASVLALLAIPVDLAFSVQRHEGRQEARGTLGWLFGLVRVRLGGPKERVRAKPERPRPRRRRRGRVRTRRATAMLRVEGFGWRLLRLARDLFRRIHIRDLSLEVRLGLADPADTGRLWGVVGPLIAMLPSSLVTRLAVEAEFTREALEVEGKGSIRIIPVQLLFVMLVFVLSPSTLRALHTARAAAP
jgi:hypothetical protein